MKRRDRTWRLALWLMTGAAILSGTLWAVSYPLQVNLLTEPDADELTQSVMQYLGPGPYPGYTMWFDAPPNFKWAMLHQIGRGMLVLRVPIDVDPSLSSKWLIEPTLDTTPRFWWDVIDRWPRRLGDGIFYPLWIPTLTFALAALLLSRLSPARRAARRARIRLSRESPGSVVRVLCMLAIAGIFAWVGDSGVLFFRYVFLGAEDLGTLGSVNAVFLVFVAFKVLIPCTAAVFTYRRLKWRRARIDRPECIHCRYNLTANESGTCPECGNPIHPRQAAWLAARSESSASIGVHPRPLSP